MTKRIEHKKNVEGKYFLAVAMDSLELHNQLTEMMRMVGKDKFVEAVTGIDSYELTVVRPSEYIALTESMGLGNFVEAVQRVLDYEIDDLTIMGLGRANEGKSVEYRVLVESDKLSAVRTRFGLVGKGFEISVGTFGGVVNESVPAVLLRKEDFGRDI